MSSMCRHRVQPPASLYMYDKFMLLSTCMLESSQSLYTYDRFMLLNTCMLESSQSLYTYDRFMLLNTCMLESCQSLYTYDRFMLLSTCMLETCQSCHIQSHHTLSILAYYIWSVIFFQSPMSISMVSLQRNVIKETWRPRWCVGTEFRYIYIYIYIWIYIYIYTASYSLFYLECRFFILKSQSMM